MIKLFKTRAFNPQDSKKSIYSLEKKKSTKHQSIKSRVKAAIKRSKEKTSAFELLFLSNFYWSMNDFGDAIIK